MKKVLKKDSKTIIIVARAIIALVLLVLAYVFESQVLFIMAYSVLCIGDLVLAYLTRDEKLQLIINIAFAVIWGLYLIKAIF